MVDFPGRACSTSLLPELLPAQLSSTPQQHYCSPGPFEFRATVAEKRWGLPCGLPPETEFPNYYNSTPLHNPGRPGKFSRFPGCLLACANCVQIFYVCCFLILKSQTPVSGVHCVLVQWAGVGQRMASATAGIDKNTAMYLN